MLAFLTAWTGTQTTANARSQRWAANSVLAQGQWTRITVQADSIYFLADSQLAEMGINPANVRVYGYGGHRQSELIDAEADWDDLEEVSLLPVSGGYLFHADGLLHWKDSRHVRNHYARKASYFVTEADSPVPPFPTAGTAPSAADGPATTFEAYALCDPEVYAFFQGGRKLFDGSDVSGGARTYTLHLPAQAATTDGLLRISFAAANLRPMELTTTFNGVEFPPEEFPEYPDDYSYAVVRCDNFDVSNIDDPSTIRLSATSGRRGRLEYIELVYTGLARISSDRPYVQFCLPADKSGETIRVEYANGQQPQLWRLAEPGRPAAMMEATTTTADGRPMLCAAGEADGLPHRYVAFDAAASYAQPAVDAHVDNQNLHATEALDMVVITPASGIFDEQAQRLADAHREADGLRVGVFRADQIYNEFSSGTPDATAYRRFLKMLYDRAADKATDAPRYLLLFGDAAWDNRMLSNSWKNYSPDDFLLCYESENSTHDIKCYVDEDYFALLDDGEGANLTFDIADMGVGRFPVRTVEEATMLVDKTINYIRLQQAGAWRNVVCFMGDDGDDNQHQSMAEDAATRIETTHPEVEVRKIYWDAYPAEATTAGKRYPQVQQVVRKQMEEGALMLNYTGHGQTYTISQEQVIRIEDFAGNATPHLPLWVTAACDILPFDGQKDNIGEAAILNPDGGAVAFYGTTRTVYATSNVQTNRAFCSALLDFDARGRQNRLGDAVRISKHITDLSHPENRLHFALLGDPALRMGNGGNRVVLDAINGIPVEEATSQLMLGAGAHAKLTGHIENRAGELTDDFQGTICVRLYDSESDITCLNNDNSARTPFTFSTFDKKLYEVQGYVRDGAFSFTCPVPLDIAYSGLNGRMVFYAVNDDRSAEATGYSEDFRLGGTAEDLDDFDGPEITAYLDREDFADGQAVGPQPTFVARLSDPSGISYLDTGIGHNLELILDNNTAASYNLNAFYTGRIGDYSQGTVVYELPLLDEGDHRLRFRAWDLLNNYASVTLRFSVDPTVENGIADLPAWDQTSPASRNADRAVYDLAGRRVLPSGTDPRSSLRPGLYIVGGRKVLVR